MTGLISLAKDGGILEIIMIQLVTDLLNVMVFVASQVAKNAVRNVKDVRQVHGSVILVKTVTPVDTLVGKYN